MKNRSVIKAIIYNRSEAENEPVRHCLAAFTSASLFAVDSDETRRAALDECRSRGYDSKEVILFDQFRGRLIQKCPATKEMICCNYRLINTGFNCIYDCTYCYLQSYLNSYGILLFTNYRDILAGCDEFLSTINPDECIRIGTGEFTDSLMIDDYTGLSRIFIEKFAPHRNIFLEMKTKSSNVDHLLNIQEKGNAVISWSVNTEENIRRYEKGGASLAERIKAAVCAADAGYFTAFHFDPVLLSPGWEHEYKKVIDAIFDSVDDDKILWISMGGFRFTPAFKDIMRSRFPGEDITLSEFIPCPDGKMRYVKPLRRELYRSMKKMIEERSTKPYLYMCMESADMWDAVFNRVYASSDDLEKDFSLFLKKKLS